MKIRKFNTLTEFLLSKASSPAIGDTVEFQGYDTIGTGASKWKFEGVTGETPSQPPTLSSQNLTDGNGNEWVIIDNGVSRLNAQLGLSEDFETQKYQGRTLFGNAADYNEDAGSPVYSWLGKDDYIAPNGSSQPNLGWVERNATAASYASEGSIGLAGAAHTSNMTGGGALGLIGAAVNDNEVDEVNAWAAYFDAKSYPAAGKATWGCELALANLGDYVGPYDSSDRKTYGLTLAAGADPAINGFTEDLTLGINFTTNGARWTSGVSFGSNSLREFTKDSLAFSKAMVMRNSMQIGWEDGTGVSNGFIRSVVTSDTSETGIILKNDNIAFLGAGTKTIFQALDLGDDYLAVQSRNINPRITANGPSTDIDIRLETKGNGQLDLAGGVNVNTAAVPVNFTADSILDLKIGGVLYKVPVRVGAW